MRISDPDLLAKSTIPVWAILSFRVEPMGKMLSFRVEPMGEVPLSGFKQDKLLKTLEYLRIPTPADQRSELMSITIPK
jgi:hypothetical protein